jgi:hypothetical protein
VQADVRGVTNPAACVPGPQQAGTDALRQQVAQFVQARLEVLRDAHHLARRRTGLATDALETLAAGLEVGNAHDVLEAHP